MYYALNLDFAQIHEIDHDPFILILCGHGFTFPLLFAESIKDRDWILGRSLCMEFPVN